MADPRLGNPQDPQDIPTSSSAPEADYDAQIFANLVRSRGMDIEGLDLFAAQQESIEIIPEGEGEIAGLNFHGAILDRAIAASQDTQDASSGAGHPHPRPGAQQRRTGQPGARNQASRRRVARPFGAAPGPLPPQPTPNTSFVPAGTGRQRVDPSTGVVTGNIMDVFPVAIAACQCPMLDHDAAEWMNPSQNSHGQSVKIAARVMPEIERFFAFVVSTQTFPYKTVEDIIRHAVNRHVGWLDAQGSSGKHFVQAMKSITNITREEEIRSEVEESLSQNKKLIQGMAERGHIKEANKIASRVLDSIDAINPGPHKDLVLNKYLEFLSQLADRVKVLYPNYDATTGGGAK